ncbi:hypothetical protein EAE96_000993 [Botrytis aclada]|nr:hypothetical protein EAE96_000993 [Botrytis aclada]
MNKLAERTNVTKYLRAKETKERMEKDNPEVVRNHILKKSDSIITKVDAVNRSLPEPRGSRPRKDPSDVTQTGPHTRKPAGELDLGEKYWLGIRKPQDFFRDQLPPSVGDPKKTPKNTPRGKSRDRSDPQKVSNPPVSPPQEVESQKNSGKYRVPSRRTSAELDPGSLKQDIVREWKGNAQRW